MNVLAGSALGFFGQRLAGYRQDQPAFSLSYANRRRLEMARALATEPSLLLLDEPTAGMNPRETLELRDHIVRMRDDLGLTILVIEHDMRVVKGVSDRVVACDYGQKIAEGSYEEVANDEHEIEAYLRKDKDKLAADREQVLQTFPRVRERLKQKAGTLSGGEQQMVAMGRALMADPKVLLMDEPSMGLAPVLVEQVFEIIRQIRALGKTIFVVEQNANMALSIADRGYVLQTGEIVLSGDAQELLNDPLMRQAYLGEL